MIRTQFASKLPEYNVWYLMKARCYKPVNTSYKNYGAKGIKVCERWLASFWNFYEDMGPRPTPGHSIDRIDGTGNYEPSNCRWATIQEQPWNKERTAKILYDGKLRTVTELVLLTGLSRNTILYRYRRGITLDKPARTLGIGRRAWSKGKRIDKSRICVGCATEFLYKKKDQQFCSNSCARVYQHKVGRCSCHSQRKTFGGK